MYAAQSDPYCYPGTTVLKNLADIRDQSELERFESDIAKQRADETLPRGRLTLNHYYAIHRHLFRDVYVWAGKPRIVRISKSGSMFCYPENIGREMRGLFSGLHEQNCFRAMNATAYPERAAHFIATLNAIHPFRDGNGRTQLAFLKILTLNAGHSFKLLHFRPSEFLQAMISSFSGNETSF
jgi:cell filamentation protein